VIIGDGRGNDLERKLTGIFMRKYAGGFVHAGRLKWYLEELLQNGF
jgi:hypothetical protein